MKSVFAFCLLLLLLFVVTAVRAGAAEPPADLRFSTYLGGQHGEIGEFVAVALSGSVYVTGWTRSTDFPVVNGLSHAPAQEEFRGFLTGFTPDGSVLFSTYLTSPDAPVWMGGLAVSKERVVVGWTAYTDQSDNEPYSVGYVASVAQGGGPVIFKAINSEIHAVAAGPGGVWVSGRFGRETEYGIATGNFLALLDPETLDTLKTVYFDDPNWWVTFEEIAVDAAGYIYVAANMVSHYDMMKLSPDGRSILYTVPLEGNGDSWGPSLAVDATGRASLAVTTSSPDRSVTAPVQVGFGGGDEDVFLVTLDPVGNVLLATYLGGAGADGAGGIAVDRTGGLYLSGYTRSTDFPVTKPLARPCTGDPICGDTDAFLVHLGPPGSGVLESTLLGGSSSELGSDIALAPTGVVAVGVTGSSDFPIVNAFQPVVHSPPGGDVFVSSLTVFNHPPNCSAATASPSVIWPPDRRQVRISTLGVTDPDGDPVTLKVTRILQDELFTARMADAGSLGVAKPWVRADRMDNGDGRVYHLFFEATDPAGAKCTGEVKVCVPIQSGGACRDGGARFDSTTPR